MRIFLKEISFFLYQVGKKGLVMYYDVKESGKRIKELRKKIGYTQESFASEIGISHRTYSGIESGAHSTSIDTLVEISK